MSGNAGFGFCGCNPLSSRFIKWNSCHSYSPESKFCFTGTTGTAISAGTHSNPVEKKLWVVEVGRIRIHQPEAEGG
ncbi:MAG: hypothetical protein L6Q53_12740 [Candidatus Brocadia sinica]|uniref:hypothetical protein n=1 Tax=Candidatus Brocadia sp. AMX2 TaxID=2293635 RepID=UPI001E3A412B|nr:MULTISPECIES: hypothetical protein [Brocadia]MCK6469047.1 hypothetical protein [Candidatus Brocadia sinica]